MNSATGSVPAAPINSREAAAKLKRRLTA